MSEKKAVSCISGLDSFSYALAWRARGYQIYPIFFYYGQKAIKEIVISKWLSRKVGFQEPIVISLGDLRKIWKGTQLTDSKVQVEYEYVPTVVVPIRNVVMLSVACAYALSIGASVVTYGAHLNDIAPRSDTGEPLYPDCSPDINRDLEKLMIIAHFPVGRKKLEIWSPARENLTKVDNLRRGYDIAKSLIFRTWSCYLNGRYHCGRCESCRNRHRAFIQANIQDKTKYEAHPVVEDVCRDNKCGFKPLKHV
jgi:7-cyano-7-deazaguanine synthase